MSTYVNFPDFPPDLTGQIVKHASIPGVGAGFWDIWRCTHNAASGSVQVAVKALRFQADPGLRERSMMFLRREVEIWRRLDHPNIVQFLGIAEGLGYSMSLVSLWMANGTLDCFLREHDFELELTHRLQLLLDISSGLEYLHSLPLIHGDLSSVNVLVDENHSARLADFGLSTVPGEIPETLGFLESSPAAGALRWTSPERYPINLIATGKIALAPATEMSDIYSLGSLALQVLSGQRPWSPYSKVKHHIVRSSGTLMTTIGHL
ncbi:hypothetical protein HYDPIDRAFT_40439 [Hydnomerulius pinastri MD-312]|uniref:Protein kinase domain-containing protein n=1 Tax=Hydnomerulius pinastri MD-312 TaxID=994086 RepID=A0A0C9VFE2_9AGAM|nr:hypothetical protein HYDPIDRAFT_40439 [Hydnomerulius pinastri MD-312]